MLFDPLYLDLMRRLLYFAILVRSDRISTVGSLCILSLSDPAATVRRPLLSFRKENNIHGFHVPGLVNPVEFVI